MISDRFDFGLQKFKGYDIIALMQSVEVGSSDVDQSKW